VPEEFENAALFLRLFLPSTVNRHKNGAFRLHVDGKHFENGDFTNDVVTIFVIFMAQFSSNTNPK